ncbi:hypothetical protein ES705_40756 [subsurface metagenome]
MMLGSDHNIFHPSILCHPDPLTGIKFYRIELSGVFLVFVNRNSGRCLDPFSMADGFFIYTKTCIPPPFHTRVKIFLSFI